MARPNKLMVASQQGIAVEEERTVDLVRRRSGGGTVFHDHFNVNYSVIRPTAHFTRDRAAEMIARAIRAVNDRARVNERHDIILDQGSSRAGASSDSEDMHVSQYEPATPLKISGSAYKLTRNRALHHGTCLIKSPHLKGIGQFLGSPACGFMQARGVDSVRSPVGNLYKNSLVMHNGFSNAQKDFQRRVILAFVQEENLDMTVIEAASPSVQEDITSTRLVSGPLWVVGCLGEELGRVPQIEAGMKELQSPDWIYGQTPQLILSADAAPVHLSSSAQGSMTARSGVIQSSNISLSANEDAASQQALNIEGLLKDKKIHEIDDFVSYLSAARFFRDEEKTALGTWLNHMFGKTR
ncbi:Biotin/lipoate A/B protein ligase [Agyrium rufum]|nr:Biotin/lipoate A/B protein ligase [Agyrium rufum]